MGEAKRRAEWRKKMGDVKVVSLDGKPIPPPGTAQEKPQEPAATLRKSIAEIYFENGTFNIKTLIPIPIEDLCLVMAQLLLAGLAKKKNEKSGSLWVPGGG
jgi:hypothetical protein